MYVVLCLFTVIQWTLLTMLLSTFKQNYGPYSSHPYCLLIQSAIGIARPNHSPVTFNNAHFNHYYWLIVPKYNGHVMTQEPIHTKTVLSNIKKQWNTN